MRLIAECKLNTNQVLLGVFQTSIRTVYESKAFNGKGKCIWIEKAADAVR